MPPSLPHAQLNRLVDEKVAMQDETDMMILPIDMTVAMVFDPVAYNRTVTSRDFTA